MKHRHSPAEGFCLGLLIVFYVLLFAYLILPPEVTR